MSVNIPVWDWKYRIFFDAKVRSQVERFISRLQGEERGIYNKIKNYYLGFYSLSLLIDAVKSDPQQAQKFIDYAWIKKDSLIKTPRILYQSIREGIEDLEIAEHCRLCMCELAEYSAAYGQEARYTDICGTLYGDWFSLMMEEVMQVNEPQELNHGEKLSEQDAAHLHPTYYNQLCGNALLNSKFGSCAIGLYETKIENGTGYAEWWDRELVESNEDLLVLYTNADSLNSNDLYYTIIHEMYPGHGHFYNTVTHSGHLVDHGAMSIIEGWATYAEWNSIESAYAKTCRNNALLFLKENALNDVDERAARIYQRKIKQGYSESEALRTTRYATQYLGYLESYYYGALWIELFMKKNNILPCEFLYKKHRRFFRDMGEYKDLTVHPRKECL